MKNHVSGEKISGTHTTYIDAAAPVVKYLLRCPFVQRFSLGIINAARSRDRRIKMYPMQGGGWKLVIYGSAYFQEVYVYTTNDVFVSSLKERMKARYIVQRVSVTE